MDIKRLSSGDHEVRLDDRDQVEILHGRKLFAACPLSGALLTIITSDSFSRKHSSISLIAYSLTFCFSLSKRTRAAELSDTPITWDSDIKSWREVVSE